MAIIETQREDIQALEGLHLFHFATSNCSQRVRLMLHEKGVRWESHHVNLAEGENATPEFIALNPNGVVPVLVHDGVTHIESNDIIQYVDEKFEGPRLSPSSDDDIMFLSETLKRSSDFQGALKLLTHEFLFKPVRRMNEDQLAKYAVGTKNEKLIAFMKEFSSKEGFGKAKISAAVAEVEDLLAYLEQRLDDCSWRSGDEFGLADISWVVNLHRFQHMKYPLERYKNVVSWLESMRSRPSFVPAISRFESAKMMNLFKGYTFVRRLKGTSVRSYLED